MQRSEAAKLVGMLIAAYPAAKATEETARVFVTMLVDLEFTSAQKAIARLVSTSQFFPSVAEIRKAAAEVDGKRRRSGADAWLDVVEQMRAEGYCGKPKWMDPIVADVVRRWGWRSLCCEGDPTADRARFIQLYDALAERWWQEERVPESLRLPKFDARKLFTNIGNGGVK